VVKKLLLCLFIFSASLWLFAKDGDNYKAYAFEEIKEINRFNKFQKIYQNLVNAKYALLNGNTLIARSQLHQIEYPEKEMEVVKWRYLAVIEFIEGNYKASLENIQSIETHFPNTLKQTCLLKLMNYIILDEKDKLRIEAPRCLIHTERFSKNNNFWINSLLAMKLQPELIFASDYFTSLFGQVTTTEEMLLWLKLGIYANQEKLVIPHVADIEPEMFANSQIKNLLAYVYYRQGNYDMTMNFLDGLESANSENIRGNLYLKDKKYELAYGHFKLALQRIPSSENAIQRILPLAWLLEAWDEGLQYVSRYQVTQKYDKSILYKAALLSRKGSYEEAHQTLDRISSNYAYFPPLEFLQLASFLSLELHKSFAMKGYSQKACQFYDGSSCYLYYMDTIWEDIAQTIKRPQPISVFANEDIENLKTAQQAHPLTEDIIITPEDIEKMDELLLSEMASYK